MIFTTVLSPCLFIVRMCKAISREEIRIHEGGDDDGRVVSGEEAQQGIVSSGN